MVLYYSAIKFLCIFLKYLFVWNSFLCRIKAFTFEEWFEREFYDIEYWTSYFMKRNGTGISVREEICWVKRGNCRKSKNRKPSFSSILSNCLYSHGIIVNTLLKISKRRLYYVKKKKEIFFNSYEIILLSRFHTEQTFNETTNL